MIGTICCAAGRSTFSAGLNASLKRVIAGSAAFAAANSDGASPSSAVAGPESWITALSAGGSSGATGRRTARVGRAIPSVVFSDVSVVRSWTSNGTSALTVAVSDAFSAAVALKTWLPAASKTWRGLPSARARRLQTPKSPWPGSLPVSVSTAFDGVCPDF